MIKAIFFDLDGVLTTDESGEDIKCKNISELTGIPIEKVRECHTNHWNARELCLGNITHKDIWDDFCNCIGKKLDIKELPDILRKVSKNSEMFELVEKLKMNSYKTGVITDNDKERFAILTDELKLNNYFNSLILSADLVAFKTEEKIFNEALKSLNVTPEESVFIDNKERNLEIPAKMGFKTYFYETAKNDINTLKNQLIEWGIGVE